MELRLPAAPPEVLALVEANRMTHLDVDLAAIEALGEYVSDCRWSAEAGLVRGLDGASFPEIATAIRNADAEWIAFFDPPTVRRIVAELRQLRAAHRRLLDALRNVHPPHRDVEGCRYCGLIHRFSKASTP